MLLVANVEFERMVLIMSKGSVISGIFVSNMSVYRQQYNNSRRHNQIYMDINYAGDYSCHILS